MKEHGHEALPGVMAPEVSVEQLGYLLVEVSKLHRTHAHAALEALGLYRGQNFVLTALSEQEGLAQSELAERLLVRPPTISNSLERMEASGWVVRRPDPEDRRISRVYLTGAGRELQQAVQSLWHDLEVHTFSGLTAEERNLLWQMLRHICQNLGRGALPPTCQAHSQGSGERSTQ
jgi:DNA-binding MarR family transcriptional regulator